MMSLIKIAKKKARSIVNFYKDPEESIGGKVFMGIAAAQLAAMCAALPLLVIQVSKAKNDYAASLGHLDTNISYIFQSTTECLNKGLSNKECFTAQNKVIKIANSSMTKWQYKRKDQCQIIHGTCSSETIETESSGIPYTGSMSSLVLSEAGTKRSKSTNSYPLIVAWQMSSVDPKIVQPLYSARDEGYAIRRDGQLFELNR